VAHPTPQTRTTPIPNPPTQGGSSKHRIPIKTPSRSSLLAGARSGALGGGASTALAERRQEKQQLAGRQTLSD